jgi:CHASE2 domain-containing sensor protein
MLRGGSVSYNGHDGQVMLRDGSGRVVRSIPVDEALNFIVDEKESATLDRINHPYHEVFNNLDNADYLRNLFGGKVAIVGYKDKDDLRTSAKGESRYGVQIQANAVSDILQGIHISRQRPLSNFLFIAAMTAVGFALGGRYRHVLRYRVPIEFSVVKTHLHLSLLPFLAGAVYLLLAVVLYQHNRTILGITYHIAVLFLAFWLVGIVRGPARSPRR